MTTDHTDLPEVDTAAPAAGATTSEDVLEAMKDVVDPELGINVVDLGLVYGAHVIEDQTQQALEGLVASYRVNWVWMPPWGPDKITDDGREMLRALGFNIG